MWWSSDSCVELLPCLGVRSSIWTSTSKSSSISLKPVDRGGGISLTHCLVTVLLVLNLVPKILDIGYVLSMLVVAISHVLRHSIGSGCLLYMNYIEI